ncbi:xanthine dehydrogenase accessory protein XdhC [Roseitranquillus sediminis]|uniref:xanthine dehydrogenase accessory protein XdhC n=1 Tax=Roseitranquillus sediminis TaxID=2809051 RepID=UPI001D0C2D47|nr:xanthine dehydrogenase accessory protein XdhC [Roseitranquillus sediminis]MBM9594264.1 xanthine dehydrogenase accessory protein XdhC [Roseitranquillus sediminis]
MSFEREALAGAVARHGRVARVVVAASRGSVPREVGASMLVWPDGQSGTIGGGALEWEAARRARDADGDRLDRIPLGPAVGQCCGGSVMLLTEAWDAARLATAGGDVVARPVPGTSGDAPLAVRRILNAARSQGRPVVPQLVQGWMIEPQCRPLRRVWIWGAGHVGRALVATLAPLPDLSVTWIDTARDRFPPDVPDGVEVVVASDPPSLVARAPAEAEHLVLTFSHALDLELCHRLLGHGFATCGLIGSATKWARFRRRLAQLGHGSAQIARIDCPIGDPSLGKHPQAIAVGVAAALLRRGGQRDMARDITS